MTQESEAYPESLDLRPSQNPFFSLETSPRANLAKAMDPPVKHGVLEFLDDF